MCSLRLGCGSQLDSVSCYIYEQLEKFLDIKSENDRQEILYQFEVSQFHLCILYFQHTHPHVSMDIHQADFGHAPNMRCIEQKVGFIIKWKYSYKYWMILLFIVIPFTQLE